MGMIACAVDSEKQEFSETLKTNGEKYLGIGVANGLTSNKIQWKVNKIIFAVTNQSSFYDLKKFNRISIIIIINYY